MKRLIEVGSVDIEAIKQQFPLASVVQQDVNLKRNGKGVYGCCPFHDDRSPSFYVFDDERYHCFGCQAHGDLFDYIEARDGLGIQDAARMLCGDGIIPVYDADRAAKALQEKLKRDADNKVKQAEASAMARALWEKGEDIFDHPYLAVKGIDPHNCRKLGNALLIPMMGTDGKIQNVQRILPDGDKRFAEGAPTTGMFVVIGGKVSKSETPVMITEGYATACSVHEATGYVTVCAFSSGNIVNVAKLLKERYPEKKYVVAADDDRNSRTNTGKAVALAAVEATGCGVIFPVFPEGSQGKDFNDMVAEYGKDVVHALIVDGEIPEGDIEPVAEMPCVAVRTLTPFDVSTIAPRPWVIKGWLLERNVAMLIAPPGVGKSTITLHQAIAIATGKTWGPWVIKKPGNVMLINVEDDLDEMMRRTAAALQAMDVDQQEIAGKLFIHDGEREFLITKSTDNGKEIVWSPLVGELVETIRKHDIRVLIVDPFAETFNGQENDNNEMKRAATGFRQVARQANCSVMLVHHTSKNGASAAGDMYASRGGSAQVGVVRTAATLMGMSTDDAEQLGLPASDRRYYVRWDDAKSNQSLVNGEPVWFKKVGIDIGNGVGLEEGDNVGALEPWTPPNPFQNITGRVANLILDELASGAFKEDRRARDNGDWAGCPVMRIAEKTEEQAARILKEWKKNGVLESFRDKDPTTRHQRVFLRVNHKNRPT